MIVRNERGLVGKMLIVWLLVLAIVALGILDFVSITTTRFHIADLASQAAQAGATASASGGPQTPEKTACAAAAASLATADPMIKMTKCALDTATKELTITVRKTAHTIAASHIGFLQKFTRVEDTETAGPSTL